MQENPAISDRVLERYDISWDARRAAGVAAGHSQRSDGGGSRIVIVLATDK
jgi:hypothetical protein